MQETYGDIARRVVGKLVSTHDGGGENDHLTLDTWEWPQGVAIYSLLKVYERTKDAALLSWLKAWYQMHLRKGLPPRNVNTTAPMLGMVELYALTGEAQYPPLIRAWAGWIMDEMPRTEEGGLQHITTHDENPQQLWDDTLFMTVLFLYRAGQALGEESWMREAEYQFLLHIKYLSCAQNRLWYHGWTFQGRHHFGGAFWARGNSWYTAGGVEFAQMLPEGPVRRAVLEAWRGQCEQLCALQDEATGLWHTLLDHEDSYLETSASAAIAYGLLKGVRLDLLPEACRAHAEKAAAGVLSQVAPDGTVQGVSYGTPMGRDLDFYRQIPICPTAYGQGLVFLMLTELMDAQ